MPSVLFEARSSYYDDQYPPCNLSYIEELVMAGRWPKVESYLAGFTAIGDHDFSTKAFFKIRKKNYLESLDQHELEKVFEILLRWFEVFKFTNQKFYMDLILLLNLENFKFMKLD